MQFDEADFGRFLAAVAKSTGGPIPNLYPGVSVAGGQHGERTGIAGMMPGVMIDTVEALHEEVKMEFESHDESARQDQSLSDYLMLRAKLFFKREDNNYVACFHKKSPYEKSEALETYEDSNERCPASSLAHRDFWEQVFH